MPQFEVGQQELIDVHYYTILLDLHAVLNIDKPLYKRVQAVNAVLANDIYFSTQKTANYDKFLTTEEFTSSRNKKMYKFFLDTFLRKIIFTLEEVMVLVEKLVLRRHIVLIEV